METGIKDDYVEYLHNGYMFIKYGPSWIIRKTCGSVMKEMIDSEIAIPVDWLEAFGADLELVERWVAFVNSVSSTQVTLVDTEFELDRKDWFTCNYYDSIPVYHTISRRHDDSTKHPKDHATIKNNKFYRFKLCKAASEQDNFFSFLLLRFLADRGYEDIPRKTLEILPKLSLSKDKNLTALLLAYHAKDDRSSYYGMCEAIHDASELPDFLNPTRKKREYTLKYAWNKVYLIENKRTRLKTLLLSNNFENIEIEILKIYGKDYKL